MLVSQMTFEDLCKAINKEFTIKINGKNFEGGSISTSVGITGFREIIDNDQTVENIFRKAIESPLDVYKQKLRRGLTVRFYAR